jgi:hypothetical protein
MSTHGIHAVAERRSLAMKHEIKRLSDVKRQEKIQELTDGLLMPTGEFGAALFAAILILIVFWTSRNGM